MSDQTRVNADYDDELKRARVTHYQPTSQELTICGLIGCYHYIEKQADAVRGAGLSVETRELILEPIVQERQWVEGLLAAWVIQANDFTIAVLYYFSFHHQLQTIPIGYDFAEFLCRMLGAERVFKLMEELPESEAKNRLMDISAELLERGGG